MINDNKNIGYSLEFPVVYRFYGLKQLIKWLIMKLKDVEKKRWKSCKMSTNWVFAFEKKICPLIWGVRLLECLLIGENTVYLMMVNANWKRPPQ